ncbi:phosphatidylinositol 3-kinase 2 [Trypanosoma theileri]|uniref:Phosphatidylinositol 3-kinase 2 n=1 Tax=Trypanosoma theileri TaxID=67003 RepID=A0A1X0NPD0_9TRYP|nr:phosphatidylinositol 3-kinase 2 [Trypanosoma theileri]ORC86378.1 phosphatidylinositol 3-kinase 2 [Trypanosoma theileri]
MASPRNILQSKGINIEEALEADDYFEVDATEEFERLVESSKRTKRNVTEISNVINTIIFQEKDEDTESDIKSIIEYITGSESHWCSNGPEVNEFRMFLAASFQHEWDEFQKVNPSVSLSRAMRTLPQCFSLPSLQKTQLEMLTRLSPRKLGQSFGIVLLRIWYVDLAGCTCSSLREFPFDMKALEAIRTTMERLFSVTNFDKSKNRGLVYIFRIQGRKEYVYGEEILINFRYIRDCVTQQREINVVVESHKETLFTDPLFVPSYPSVVMIDKNELNFNKESLATVNHQSEISLWDLNDNLIIESIDSLQNLVFSQERAKEEGVREGDSLYISILVEVYFGGKLCCLPQMTKWVSCRDVIGSKELTSSSSSVNWKGDNRLKFGLLLSDAPRELKLCITVIATCGERINSVVSLSAEEILQIAEELPSVRKSDEYHVSPIFFLGSASLQFFDYLARMRMGRIELNLWNTRNKANPMSPSLMNSDKNSISLSLVFPTFTHVVRIPSGKPPVQKRRDWEQQFFDREFHLPDSLRKNKIEQLKQVKRILSSDPLSKLTPSDEVLLWKYREELVLHPKALAKFLLAVNWLQPYAVYEAYSLMERWALLQPIDALELLDARYVDIKVREHAVKFLDNMSDYELKGCALQLVQVLKHEPYHYSALSRFLLRRSLRSPHVIGHYVFWYLVSEMGNSSICERHGLLLEELIRRMPERRSYLRQLYVTDLLFETALRVKDAQKRNRVDCLREHLKSLRLPSRFTLALHPSMECSGLEIGKCNVMDSKKFPLWLVFRNYQKEEEPFYAIFKVGDDLRQDLLTLQLLELMDSLWKSCGLHLHIIPYGCVATGAGVGMIEVVLNSDTIANITRKDGGAQAAFSEEPLMNWLRHFNRERQDVERCLWNFLYSVAGYTVATYVLGIGDRHNDNIMLRQDGTLFHIDFGHFLGNFKTKFGIKRETAPFIFTPMYAYMLGGQSSPIYLYFVDVACQAFNVVRRFSSTLMIHFLLMLSTGIPELQKVEDIEWLRSVLLIGRTDEEAKEHYKIQISLAIANIRTLFNDYIHIMTH